tara:strand:+ start:313 stop:837 length:525 start_codon:yes stop_codon:yes gene_type:complete
MNKRFALTTAGIATAAIGSTAAAELISFSVHQDRYIGEATWQLVDSASNTIASMYISSSYIFIPTSQSSTYSVGFGAFGSSIAISGYLTTFDMDLAAGNYYVFMQDTWGDGWAWSGNTGLDAFTVAGNIDGGSASFAFTTGASAVGAFTVNAVPAPGALALLGLAGLASRRKRK